MELPGPNLSGIGSLIPSRSDILVELARAKNYRDHTSGLERRLWVLTGLVLSLDIVTTIIGLQLGFQESNPIARLLLDQYDYLAFVGLKGFSLMVAIAGWTVMPRQFRYIVPGCVACPWAVGSLVNGLMILRVVGT
jgi:hypothetical protein